MVDAIAPICRDRRILMDIVVGPGFPWEQSVRDTLLEWGNERWYFTRETGMMAQIMSRCQLAFVSNGRTVYELAHMHVPAVVVSHSERENTHDFARDENGFYNLGVYEQGETKYRVREAFELLLFDDVGTRWALWEAMRRFDLSGNKARVARRILEVVDG
ncbi:MAG: hypothetical protein GWN58_66315 [Anaerolineae bacterium]|nr:hypothetical protein [Anaerolineae bacterium]